MTGDLTMTAAVFRSTATGTSGGGSGQSGPPEITALSANGSTEVAGLSAGNPVSFHPNGDGLDDTLVITHTVTRAAQLDATVTDPGGSVVRTYSLWSNEGTSTSEWNGKNDAGAVVPDGQYTLTYTPRDDSGATGTPVSVNALVLTAFKLGLPSAPALFARDADALSKQVKVTVTVSKPAQVGFQVADDAGNIVRTVRASTSTGPATLSFAWDGTTDSGSWAPDGWYTAVVTGTTALGTYAQARRFYAGAFRITPSIDAPVRGGSLTLTINSTETLAGAPVVHVSQPGLASWDVSATHVSGSRYKVALTLQDGGTAGALDLDVAGTDKYGGTQDTTLSLTLR